ncbi:hypothetical protein AB6735_18755 [Mucilaginibacter sp. RCC_168]|uniref:hypothetical protein n=1 Tax=Mucilaginibacter sp. RCC_168 TaxID=3239221 RepID=UPI0035250030
MSALGMYASDGNDWYGTYGVIVGKNGSDDFLKFWDRKPPMQHDWADQNGVDTDTQNVFFKAKDISIPIAIIGNDEADFWAKHKAFFNHLSQPGTRRIYVNELSRSFYCYYDSCTDFSRLTRIKTDEGNRVACKYTLKFIEPAPSFFTQFAFLTDKDGNYLVTQTGNKLIVS